MKLRKFFVLLSVVLFAGFMLAACGDDDLTGDEGSGSDNAKKSLVVGTWDVTKETGYELTNGKKTDEWTETYRSGELCYIFKGNGTGILREEEDEAFTWKVSGDKLILSYGEGISSSEDDEDEVYTIKSISKKDMVLALTDEYGIYIEHREFTLRKR